MKVKKRRTRRKPAGKVKVPRLPVAPGEDDGYKRSTLGQFQKGNRGGPGNVHGPTSGRFRTLLFRCVTENDFQRLAKALLRDALAGDKEARTELFNRLIGKPRMSVDITDRTERDAADRWSWGQFVDAMRNAPVPLPPGVPSPAALPVIESSESKP